MGGLQVCWCIRQTNTWRGGRSGRNSIQVGAVNGHILMYVVCDRHSLPLYCIMRVCVLTSLL